MVECEPNIEYNRLMSRYNWQQPDWPDFSYCLDGLEDALYTFVEQVGRAGGAWNVLSPETRQDALLELMTAEAQKSSKIEGIQLSHEDVYSSIQRNLGLSPDTDVVGDRRAADAAQLMTEVRHSWSKPLTADLLCSWQRTLLSHSSGITLGSWRTDPQPMRIISGPLGRETVHYEAPPSSQVPQEMQRFIAWFNQTAPNAPGDIRHAPIRSALSHLYFESIHPFEDGNGRIGRAIAEKALSQGIGGPVVLSLSSAIEADRRVYYQALNAAQHSNEVSEWIRYFVHTVLDAQSRAEQVITFTLLKARFFERWGSHLNDRQLKVIRRMLREGPQGFVGGMNVRKYIAITGTSKATATRDLQNLKALGIFSITGDSAGRSTRYQLNMS